MPDAIAQERAGLSILTDPYRVAAGLDCWTVEGPDIPEPRPLPSKTAAERRARGLNREHRERNGIPLSAPRGTYTYPDRKA